MPDFYEVFRAGTGPQMRQAIDVQIFTTSGTWVNPSPTVRRLGWYRLVGAGAGGGGGRRGAAGTVRCGGGGGAPGSVVEGFFWTDDWGNFGFPVEIGAGGLGGAGQSTDSTNGNHGSIGGDTRIMVPFLSGTTLLIAAGGNFGSGGTAGTGAGGGAKANTCSNGFVSVNSLTGGTASTSGGAGASPGTSTLSLPTGGGAGGGITSGNVSSAGGARGNRQTIVSPYAVASWTTSPGFDGAEYSAEPNTSSFGQGGDGGGAMALRSGINVAGNGGNGEFPGGGGGGGGASLNGCVSGAGGKGGDGVAIIVVF
jgi:hypothetical protein